MYETALILQRVLSLITDEMLNFDRTLQADLRGIRASIVHVLNLLVEVEWQMITDYQSVLLMELTEVAYEAENVADELSYEILHRKVHKPSRIIDFLKKVAFSFQIAEKVKNLNQLLQNIKNDGTYFGFGRTIRDSVRDIRMLTHHPDFVPLCFNPCVAFCLTFPINFRIPKTELIQIWLAEGLVESFDDGYNRLSSLAFHEMVRIVNEDDISVNYMINGLENHSAAGAKITAPCRYLYATTSLAIIKDKAKKLRSLILDGVPFQESWELESLRALSLSRADVEELPSSIAMFKHLRFLDVSNTRIKALPEFITKLYNLQTFRFLNCNQLTELPRFNNLISLKNIAFSFAHQMPLGLGCLTSLQTLSFFVVDSPRGRNIQELEFLNKLRGHLEITRIENVRDGKEAMRANVQEKTEVDVVSFQWSCRANDSSSSDEEVLEGLRPHFNIQKIEIKYYMGKSWPSWMLLRTRSPSNHGSFVLENLVGLTLEQCWNCVELPPLGDLPCLKFLAILHLRRVECIYDELYQEIDGPRCLFPVLESLSICWMENLTKWSDAVSPMDGTKVVAFPCLKTLCIQSCAKFASFPMEDFSKLEKIEIKDCYEMRFFLHEQKFFPSLTSLSIEGCPKMTCLRNWFLSEKSLSDFRVRRCEWLKFIQNDLGNHNKLISLDISFCKGLTYFSGEILGKLVGLKKLSIGAFSEQLDDFHYLNKIEDLKRLEEIEIWGSDFFGRKMSHLPDQLQHLASLKSLRIKGFTTMEALPEWLCNLQSLRYISLTYCWHLEYQSTATIIQRLSNLKHLHIGGCNILEENKSQWNEFSCIKNIKIHFSDNSEDLSVWPFPDDEVLLHAAA